MTTLPSFVQLMASLGLDQPANVFDNSPSPPSCPQSPSLASLDESPPNMSTSLRDVCISRHRVSRYSPYSPVTSAFPSRRGSISSLSSSSDREESPIRASSISPQSKLKRRAGNKLSIHISTSASDLTVNTPISIYVRRKTPGASPTSPSFPLKGVASSNAVPLILPTLPPVFRQQDPPSVFPGTDMKMSGSHFSLQPSDKFPTRLSNPPTPSLPQLRHSSCPALRLA